MHIVLQRSCLTPDSQTINILPDANPELNQFKKTIVCKMLSSRRRSAFNVRFKEAGSDALILALTVQSTTQFLGAKKGSQRTNAVPPKVKTCHDKSLISSDPLQTIIR